MAEEVSKAVEKSLQEALEMHSSVIKSAMFRFLIKFFIYKK